MGGRTKTTNDRMVSPVLLAVDARRRELGWSQTQLADACFTTQSHVSALLGGRSEPTLLVLERMCAAVGLRLLTAYTGEGPQYGHR